MKLKKKVKYEQDKSTKNPLAHKELKTSHWKQREQHPLILEKKTLLPHTHNYAKKIGQKKIPKNGQIFSKKMLVVKCNLNFLSCSIFWKNSYFQNTGIRIVQCFQIEWLLIDVITSRRDNTKESPLTYRLYKGYH